MIYTSLGLFFLAGVLVDTMEILAWLMAAVIAVWSVRRVSKPVLSELWRIPFLVWADFRRPTQVAVIPLRVMTRWDVPLFFVGCVLWLAWVLAFALTLFLHLTPLAFMVFEAGFLSLAIPRAYNDPSVRRRLLGMCANDSERRAWLAFFERTHPDLAKMAPRFFCPIGGNFLRVITGIFIALFPLYSLVIQLALTGLVGLAVQVLVFFFALVAGIIPLVRWAGALVGGRYAWWIEYHLLLGDPSTR